MALRDLRDFIALLEKEGELRRIKTEVDPVLEVSEIVDRVSKKGGPALLFENPTGSKMPLLINGFGSPKRMSMALEVASLDEVAKRLFSLLPTDVPAGFLDKLAALGKLKNLTGFFPKQIKHAPCQEIVKTQDFSLDELPILKCWPQDGGRFVTLPLVITKNPKSGRQNIGMYRLQVYDDRTTGMHWHLHHDGAENHRLNQEMGKRTEVAVALGGDPATIYAATAPLPGGFDELLFAGLLRQEAVPVVKAKTVDLMVPANAEIILEGYVDPEEMRLEGPFGDHTGYYSLPDYYPVFHLTCMTHRKDPIYPATLVGRPPMEDCYMGKATERIFLPLIKAQLPEVVDLGLPFEGVFHNCVFVSIKKTYPGQARKVMNALWGMGQMQFAKTIIVVDEGVDVQNLSEVLWKFFNNVDPARDLMVVRGPLDVLDHSSPTPTYGSKLGVDATKKLKEEGHDREWPDDLVMTPEIKELVDKRWSEYGIESKT